MIPWAVSSSARRPGLSDNTLVVFTSDNGGSPQSGKPVGDMEAYCYGPRINMNGHISNGVLRGGKYNVFEGGTREPFLVRWPGHVPAGMTSPALVSQTDLQASFARLIGVTLPADAALDSIDVLDALLGKSTVGRHELVEHQYGPNCACAWTTGSGLAGSSTTCPTISRKRTTSPSSNPPAPRRWLNA